MSDRQGSKQDQFVWLRVPDVVRDFDEDETVLPARAALRAGLDPQAVRTSALFRRSLDARGRPRFVCTVDLQVEKGRTQKALRGGAAYLGSEREAERSVVQVRKHERVAVIGAGPAGLFCADYLARAGLRPILIDRGQPVEIRGRHVSDLMHRGELREDSNICFGEGGAGTWSDGKLYTRVNDVRVREVLRTIVALGGPEGILIEGKPHLGTDRLVRLCKAFRARLIERDCDVRFGSTVTGFRWNDTVEGRAVSAVKLEGGDEIEVDRVVLATGHSARQMYRILAEGRVAMEAKAFAVGFRVEHPQQLINEAQYGGWVGHKALPSADYRVAANFGRGDTHRGVYSFCMCPGGQVVPSATSPGGVCVNGMSHASRRGHWANSALVVTIKPNDFGLYGAIDGLEEVEGVLAGMAFQREAEQRAYVRGGGGFIAPAQRLADFRAGRPSRDLRKTTYKPGIAPADISRCYPEVVTRLLREALPQFERKIPGFLTNEALLIGVETRTSAPVRVLRNDTLQSNNTRGLYPCGEGSGYGGGIVSAAIDGLRIAERIVEELQ